MWLSYFRIPFGKLRARHPAELTPKPDAQERSLLSVDELLRRYNGDKDLLRELIEAARRCLY